MSSTFSIVITCYNQRTFIRDAIRSALEQQEPAHEIVVVDDGSTDRSKEVIDDFAPHITYVACRHQGANRARNYGASLTSGQYLVFLDGDDVFLPWALKVYRRILETETGATLLMCRLRFFSGALPAPEEVSTHREAAFVVYDSPVRKDRTFRSSASATVVERKAFETIGGWSHDVFPLEDVELAVKLCCAGQAVQVLAPPTVCYRVHDGNSIHNVGLFVDMVPVVAGKERSRQYPGGVMLKAFRLAYLGGSFNFWLLRCLHNRRYKDSFRLIKSGWSMMLVHLLRKGALALSAKQPERQIEV